MAEINGVGLIALFGLTIIVGYVGSLMFHKTRIADVVWLLLFGILIGPVLGLIDRGIFIAISPFLASLALMLILFDAGLNMDFFNMIRGAPRGMLMAVVGFVLTVAAVGVVAFYIIGFDFLTALFLGTILAGSSSPVVLALVSKLSMDQKNKTIMSLESIFTDPLVVVVAIALLNVIVNVGGVSPAQSIASSFSIGAIFGLILGIAWLFALEKLKGKPFDYMVTLAVLFLIYAAAENVGGSGAIAALGFGIVIGNAKAFSTMLKFKKKFTVDKLLIYFNTEVSFFIRAFFFVYLGIIATINTEFLVYGLVVSAAVILIRFLAVKISVMGMTITRHEKQLMAVMGPRGLAAAVLAQLPMSFGLKEAEAISNIVFITILVTVIYSSFIVKILDSKMPRGKEIDEDKKTKAIKEKIRAEVKKGDASRGYI